MHKVLFYNKFIIFLHMFRALLCSSSGGQNRIIQHLVSSHSVGVRRVQWLKFPLNGLRAQSRVSPVVGLLPLASGPECSD